MFDETNLFYGMIHDNSFPVLKHINNLEQKGLSIDDIGNDFYFAICECDWLQHFSNKSRSTFKSNRLMIIVDYNCGYHYLTGDYENASDIAGWESFDISINESGKEKKIFFKNEGL